MPSEARSSSSARPAEEALEERSGDNLYPAQLDVQFGDHAMHLDVPAGVWNPTPHGAHLGEMLAGCDFSGEHVLELGTGCGLHAIVIAQQGARALTLTEIDQAILDNARHNLGKHEIAVPIHTQVADWTHVNGGPFDALVTNPPFCKSGKRYRRHFIDTLILDAHKLVRPGGRLLFVQSSMADISRSLNLMRDCGMTVSVLGETSGPFRAYYDEDPAFLAEAARIPNGYSVRDGTRYERLIAFEAQLP